MKALEYQPSQTLSSVFRCGSKTDGPSGAARRSWRWAPSSSRTPPRLLLCSPSAALPAAPWARVCSWTPGSPPPSLPPPRCRPSRASWLALRACREPTPHLPRPPCPLLCRDPSSAPRFWDTAPTCPTCAPHPRCTSARLTPGTPVLPRWGWRPGNIFRQWGRHGDEEETDGRPQNVF